MARTTDLSFGATRASVSLDALRGIAALAVALGHWRGAFFLALTQVHVRHGVPLVAAYALTSLGHQAVIVFLVLSGYLVGGSVVRALRTARWSWSQYLTHRLVRLWIVLLPALVLGFAWDQLGMHFLRAPLLYAGVGGNNITPDVVATSRPSVFLGNAVFLQTILEPTFGSNVALWSLANEWWYYVLFPLGACLFLSRYRRGLPIVGSVALLVALFVMLRGGILLLFPAWLCGALLHFLPGPRRALSAPRLTVVALAYLTILCGFAFLWHQYLPIPHFAELCDNLLAIVTMLFLWLLLADQRAATDGVGTHLARGTARFSYTLYLTHLPLLVFCAGLLLHDQRWDPSPVHWLAAGAVLCLVIVYAWLIANFTEFKTDVVRTLIEVRLLQRPQVPASQPQPFFHGRSEVSCAAHGVRSLRPRYAQSSTLAMSTTSCERRIGERRLPACRRPGAHVGPVYQSRLEKPNAGRSMLDQ